MLEVDTNYLGESIGSTPLSIIELLFGKTVENLSCNDVKVLVENKVVESPRLEFKAVSEDTAEGKLAELIMKSVVGFLNSDEGEGILILGIRGKERAEELACIPRKLLGHNKDAAESKLRNWVFSYLASIPPMITPPRLIVRVFDCRECGLGCSEGWITLVYVKRAFDALYYSKLDDAAYQRRGSETRRLSLEEALHVVSAKRQPIVIVLMELKKVEENKVRLNLLMRNIGSIPTNVAVSLITISKRALLGRLSPPGETPGSSQPFRDSSKGYITQRCY